MTAPEKIPTVAAAATTTPTKTTVRLTAGFMTHRHGADFARKAGGPNDHESKT